MSRLFTVFPLLAWLSQYSQEKCIKDLIAALVVSVLLVPQSLAYALLAGLPPEVGLYASILPLIFYALFGSSSGLSVGPVAVISLMTATSISAIAEAGTIGYLEAAIALSLLSGVMLFVMGLLKLGFLANFLSHPVISGFITASGLLIAVTQAKHILGFQLEGTNLVDLGPSLLENVAHLNIETTMIGIFALSLLLLFRKKLKSFLLCLSVPEYLATPFARSGPIWVIFLTTILVVVLNLQDRGVATLGYVPSGLPSLQLPSFDFELWKSLLASAFLISLVGFVESLSIGQTIAMKRQESIDPNQELLGLGAANLGSAVSGGMPVTGGLSRSVVNADAGAATPIAGVLAAFGIGLSTLFLTPYLSMLPKATLGAIIVLAVMSLIDLQVIRDTWKYSRSDFFALLATVVTTLFVSVEAGISAGIGLSLLAYLYQTSQPHFAIVGQVPGTEHYRNIERHKVIISETVLSLRIDASLYFANARFLEQCVQKCVSEKPGVKHVIIVSNAVNDIDLSALESLESIIRSLDRLGIRLHFSELKGPVMDKLNRTGFIEHLTGKVYLTQYQAMCELDPHCTEQV